MPLFLLKASTLQKALDKIRALHDSNALHRKGWRMEDIGIEDVLAHLQEEVDELKEEPTDLYELADVMNNLFHIANLNGWSLQDIENAMIEKLELRFSA